MACSNLCLYFMSRLIAKMNTRVTRKALQPGFTSWAQPSSREVFCCQPRSLLARRCQFHQHYTRAFFAQKCFAQLSSSYKLPLWLFWQKDICAKAASKMLMNLTKGHWLCLRCSFHCSRLGLDLRHDLWLSRSLGQEDWPRGTHVPSPWSWIWLLQYGTPIYYCVLYHT